ncbi:HAD family hydrolase [Spartinivicinus ruber]|uniref:HAD family hydrolase n=1 Tax=Spartinivicinus ruber TaxID=2683272 RepID=UPI0013D66249|nr:HAD hydrolase-like protein [Spartinivicinus ruber]
MKTIIWDFDNTLVDSNRRIREALVAMYSQVPETTWHNIQQALPMSLQGLYNILKSSNLESREYSEFEILFNNAQPKNPYLLPCIKEILSIPDIAECENIIFSRSNKDFIVNQVANNSLPFSFDDIYSDSNKYIDCESLCRFIQSINKTFEECIYVGDSSKDRNLAARANVKFINVRDLINNGLTEFKDTLLNETVSNPEMLQLQYQSLRREVAELQNNNASGVSMIVTASTVIWGFFITISLSNEVPFLLGFLFTLPAVLAMIALSSYSVNSKRVANIGAFLAIRYQKYFNARENWEFQISKFANLAVIDLSSNISIKLLYQIIFRISVYGALVVLFINLFFRDFMPLMILDQAITSLIALSIAIPSYLIKKKDISYRKLRCCLDKYWSDN